MGQGQYKYVYMIFREMALEDLKFIDFTFLTDQIPKPFRNLSLQNRLAVFGDSLKMVFQIINGMV